MSGKSEQTAAASGEPIDPTKKLTIEEWATAAKMFPQMVEETPKPRNRTPRLVANKRFWMFAAAKGGKGWLPGEKVTKAAFDAAVEQFTGKEAFGQRDVGLRADAQSDTPAAPAATGHPGEQRDQPVPADPIPSPEAASASDAQSDTTHSALAAGER